MSAKPLPFVFLIVFGVLQAFHSIANPEKTREDSIVLVMENNQVKELRWNPKMTLIDALAQRTLGEWRFVIHIWRKNSRARVPDHALDHAEKIPLQPNDIVIIGVTDQERIEYLPKIPQVAKALELSGNSTHASPPRKDENRSGALGNPGDVPSVVLRN